MTDTQLQARLAPREVAQVSNSIPLLDTSYFEHMQRIASAMASGSLIPESLRGVWEGQGNARQFVPFEEKTVVANIFRVVNQAVRWNMDPFAVIDCASVVHGRLMWEGKLVHAVVEARVGIRLNCVFGRMLEVEQEDKTKVLRFDPTVEGEGEHLAVQVVGQFPDEDTPRTIEGTVRLWKTTGNNSPWGNPLNWKRQLRYRGSREWGRAHSPAPLLGVVTNDEALEDMEIQERATEARTRQRAPKQDVIGRLPAAGRAKGVDLNHVEKETGPEGEKTADEETPHNAETGEVIEGTATVVEKPDEEVDDADRLLSAYNDGADAYIAGAAREVPSDLQEEDEAEQWLEGYDTKASEAVKVDDEKSETSKEEAQAKGADGDTSFVNRKAGPAPKDRVYLLVSHLEPVEGKLPTFKNGEAFSKVGPKGASELVAYDGHPEPADPALASQGGGTAQAEQTQAAPTGDIAVFWKAYSEAPAWADVKKAIAALFRSDDVGAMTEEDVADLRSRIWKAVSEGHPDWKVDPAMDPTAFRLWMEAIEGDDAVDKLVGCWRVLKREPVFEAMKPENQTKLQTTVEARIVALGGTVG